MARIRTIKPEFWTSEQVVELSFEARLLVIGMWNFADDHGNLSASSKRLKMQVFPADVVDVDACLLEIRQGGFISDYDVDGEKYIHIKNFTKHQKVNTNVAHKVPPPKTTSKQPATQIDADINALEKEKEKEKENNIKDEFDDWYELYPRKVGKDAALKKYHVARAKVEQKLLLKSVVEFAKSVEDTDKQYIPHPATWLNQGRWGDEIERDDKGWLV